jgi:hypothetical protein
MVKKLIFASLMLVVLALVGCSTAPATEAAAPVEESESVASAGLKITGSVNKEMAWAEDEIRAMETIDAESTNKDGETNTYTGVPINTLLDLAGVKADATTLVFVGDDGFEAEVTLEEVRACTDCIVSFRDQGGFSTVLPDFSGKAQVKGVVEIRVK